MGGPQAGYRFRLHGFSGGSGTMVFPYGCNLEVRRFMFWGIKMLADRCIVVDSDCPEVFCGTFIQESVSLSNIRLRTLFA